MVKWALYNVLFALAFPLMLPGFLLRMMRRGGYAARMLDRFALYPRGLFVERDGGPGFVWVHAVSVGEVQVAGQLMREWRAAEPDVRFCFSTTSSTGWKMAEREVTGRDVLIYNPLDFPTFVKAALATVRPRAVVLTESEIWPNFIRRARKSGIPLYLVNARVSDRSAPRYRLARWWFGDVFRSFSRIFAQSELDKARLLAAGAPSDRTDVSGSFKFDVARRNEAKEREMSEWLRSGGAGGGKVLLGGSTWPGEDELLLNIAKKLQDVTLVIAPRHFEKADAVEANILKAGFRCVRRSRGDRGDGRQGRAVFLADTTGELMGLYGIADAVFVGKSLCEHGSQNMIEPCLCGKPTVVGPYTENFRPVMSDLLEGGGIVQAKDAAEVERAVAGWFRDGDGGLGERARAAVARRTGVVGKCVGSIRGELAGDSASCGSRGRTGVLGTCLWTLGVIALLIAAFMAASVWRLHRQRAAMEEAKAAFEKEIKGKPLPKLGAIRTVGAYIAMVEKPDAVRVLLADDEAERYRGVFAQTGLRCHSATNEVSGGARYDIVFACGRRGADDLAALAAKTAERGVLAWALDVHDMTVADFKAAFEAFPCEDAHLWMPGERDWLLTGRTVPRKTKMSAVLGFFARWSVVSKEAEEAGCGSVQELFANYVGAREDVSPVFSQGNLSVPARPEFFVQKETPDIGWIVPDDMDADIVESTAKAIRDMQDVRRSVVSAAVASRAKDRLDEAVRAWADAMRRNPHDTMLLDRLYLLAVNAKAFMEVGNVAGAAQCYETMVAIRPTDIRVVEEYARCLQMLGRRALADRVMEKVKEMKRNEK